MKLFFVLVFIASRTRQPAAQTQLKVPVGGDAIVKCSFSSSGTWKIFCRDRCEGDGVLIQTTSDVAQRDRFSVRSDGRSNQVLVSISRLRPQDSGWYLCGVAAPSSSYALSTFHVTVTTEPTPLRVQPPPGATEPGPAGPGTPSQSPQEETGVSLHVGVSVLVFVLVFILVLIVFIVCRRKTSLKTEGKSPDRNMGDVVYENCCPELNYENLDPAGREKNQDYFTLTDSPQPSRLRTGLALD